MKLSRNIKRNRTRHVLKNIPEPGIKYVTCRVKRNVSYSNASASLYIVIIKKIIIKRRDGRNNKNAIFESMLFILSI